LLLCFDIILIYGIIIKLCIIYLEKILINFLISLIDYSIGINQSHLLLEWTNYSWQPIKLTRIKLILCVHKHQNLLIASLDIRQLNDILWSFIVKYTLDLPSKYIDYSMLKLTNFNNIFCLSWGDSIQSFAFNQFKFVLTAQYSIIQHGLAFFSRSMLR